MVNSMPTLATRQGYREREKRVMVRKANITKPRKPLTVVLEKDSTLQERKFPHLQDMVGQGEGLGLAHPNTHNK